MPTIPYKNSKGERLPGVTTILGDLGWNKRQLMHWAWKEGCEGRDYKDTSTKAADAGTIAHALIEANIKGILYPVEEYDKPLVEKAETAFLNFLQWKDNVKFEVIDTEPHLISEVFRFGGTPDCIARINGKIALFDWKSGNAIYEDMIIQLGAYRMLWNENYPGSYIEDGVHILRIDKDYASFTHKYLGLSELDMAWEAFLSLLKIHSLHKELKRLSN